MENKNARTSVENNLSVPASYQKRRYRAALHNVAVIHIPVAARFAAFRINAAVRHPHLKKRPRSFSLRSRWCYWAKIIAAVAVAFLLVASCFRLPAVLVRARDRLLQARHLAAAAAAAGAVVAEAAERERPAFFLVGRALHPWLLHPEAA